jgi:hypothetical protein
MRLQLINSGENSYGRRNRLGVGRKVQEKAASAVGISSYCTPLRIANAAAAH